MEENEQHKEENKNLKGKNPKKRICKYCKSETQIKTGASNWKNLFRKPTLEEWITLFIITMVILSSYAYKNDIDNLNEYYNDEDYCTQNILSEQQDINLDETPPEGFLNSYSSSLDGS